MAATAVLPRVSQSSAISSKFYRPELDALRFFAFLAVFVHHIRLRSTYTAISAPLLLTGGSYREGPGEAFKASLSAGVSLFFFLSSYLITTLLISELGKTGTIQIRSFFMRRLLRIWPLYFFYLGLVAILGLKFEIAHMTHTASLWYVFFIGNWYAVHFGWPTSLLLSLLWSISIEEQFYLIAPIFVRSLKRKGLLVFSISMMVGSGCMLLWLGRHAVLADHSVRPNTLVQALFLAGGAVTAVLLQGREWRIALPLRAALVFSGLLAWFVGYAKFGPWSPPLWIAGMAPLVDYCLVLVGVVCIFFAFFGVNSARVPKALIYLGKISYGLYVFHILALWLPSELWVIPKGHLPAVLIRGLISLGLTILFAAMSYRFLELPFLRLKERFTLIPSRAD